MSGFTRYVRYLLGLDPSVKVDAAVEEWAYRLTATREIEVAYVTEDQRGKLLDGWEPERGAADTSGTRTPVRQPDPPYGPSRDGQPVGDCTLGEVLNYFHELDRLHPEGSVSAAAYEAAQRRQKRNAAQVKRDKPDPRGIEAHSRIVREAAAAAKVKFGLPKATEANLLVVSKYVRDWLDEKKVRPTHIEGITPHAVALVFIPSRSDIALKQILATKTATSLRAEYDATYFCDSPRKWWQPSTWFGRVYARPFSG